MGDPARYLGDGVVFLANNRNKHSVVLDLKTETGISRALQLAESCDVMVEGFRPGVAHRLGIGYDAVREINPGVIYCSLTGYGQNGPMRDLAGHDLNYLAVSGVLDQLRDASGTPIVPTVQFADLLGGIVAVESILAALVQRQRTGRGQFIDISMTDALTGLLTNHLLIAGITGYEHGVEVLSGSVLCYRIYKTQDGRYMSLGALEPKFWQAFCLAVNRNDWIALQFSPAIEENPAFRELTQLFLQHDAEYWTALGNQADCCLQPVRKVSELEDQEQVRERGTIFKLETTHWGSLQQVSTHAGGHRAPATVALNEPEELAPEHD
jgi:crotonobetainyl-CoA:carnitine CoA-transferase CaiB-like acyl-CoA transferase